MSSNFLSATSNPISDIINVKMSLNYLNKNIFRANDIRGKYPSEINEEAVFNIVSAIQKLFKKSVVVGHDARLSSPSLYRAVLTALKKDKKIKIFEAGLVTSPAMYFLANKLKAGGGIMITASHNPKEYNGLKIMGKNAVPISGLDILNKILLLPQAASFAPAGKLASSSPRSVADSDHHARSAARLSDKKQNIYLRSYVNFLKKHLKIKNKLRVVFDCSNGVAGIVLKELFKGNKYIKATFLNAKTDGNFPGHGPNPLKEGALGRLQREVNPPAGGQKADLGVIFDGDGDRVFFVDDRGEMIDPDIIGFILAKMFKPPYVATTISSWRIKKIKRIVVSSVGHLFMKMAMKKNKANFGMERSGHYYFKDFFYCDGGIFAAIQIINFIGGLNKKISDYAGSLPKYYQIPETNFQIGSDVDLKRKMEKLKNFYKNKADKIHEKDGLLMEFSGACLESAEGWWFNLRLSNSENLLRLNMESDSEKLLKEKLKEVKRLLSD